MELDRSQVIKSYFELRKLLGVSNPQKNKPVDMGFEETATAFFAINSYSGRKILLLEKQMIFKNWVVKTPYSEIEPFASFIFYSTQRIKGFKTEAAFTALEKLLDYSS